MDPVLTTRVFSKNRTLRALLKGTEGEGLGDEATQASFSVGGPLPGFCRDAQKQLMALSSPPPKEPHILPQRTSTGLTQHLPYGSDHMLPPPLQKGYLHSPVLKYLSSANPQRHTCLEQGCSKNSFRPAASAPQMLSIESKWLRGRLEENLCFNTLSGQWIFESQQFLDHTLNSAVPDGSHVHRSLRSAGLD